jgi:hypothetical protein
LTGERGTGYTRRSAGLFIEWKWQVRSIMPIVWVNDL